MALDTTTSAGLTYGWSDGESGWGGPMNANLLRLDLLTVPFVLSATTVTPPTSPAAGDKYLIPAGATAEWFGLTNRVAVWENAQWVYHQPRKGWAVRVWDTKQTRVWDGDSWDVYLDTMTPATAQLIADAAGAAQAAGTSASAAASSASDAAGSATAAAASAGSSTNSATAAAGSATAAAGSASAAATSAAQAAASAGSVGASATTAVQAAAAATAASSSASTASAAAVNAASSATTSANNAAQSASDAEAAAAAFVGLGDAAGAMLVGDGVMRVATVSALRALPSPTKRTMAYLEGYHAQGDGGEGPVVWVASSTKTDNGGTVFTPASNPTNGRWERAGTKAGSIPAGWFGAVADWNGTTGTDNAAALVSALAYCEANRKPLAVKAGRYSVGTTGIVYTASTGDDLAICFEPGVELVCTYSGASYPAVLQINDIGANCKILGSKTRITYSNAPSSRGSMHAIYLYGGSKTITDLLVRSLVVTNSPNFGLAVYAGPTGGVSSGNKNVWIDDVVVIGSKGDGIHVENFDSGVKITNWRVESPGDDTVCVSNYTGASGSATKSTPTTDVEIINGNALNAYSSAVRLLGVQRCTIRSLRGTLGNSFGGSGASAISCDDTSGEYSVDNLEITAGDIETYGGAGLLYYSAGGKLQDVKISKATCKGVNNYGVRLLQASSSVGSKISDVDIEVTIQRATNSGVAGDVPVWLDKTRDVIVRLMAVNCPSVLKANATDRTIIKLATAKASGSTGTAFDLTNNTNMTLGRLVLDASCTFTTGVTATGNTNVWHSDLWDLSGATNKLSRSGNTGVRGWCQEVQGAATIGSVSAGTSAKYSFGESLFTGSTYHLQATLFSNEGFGWGISSLATDGVYLNYSAGMTGVKLHYSARTNIGY